MSKLNRWLRSKVGIVVIISVVVVLIGVAVVGQSLGWWQTGGQEGTAGLPGGTYPAPAGGYTCLPTCSETDGKFLHISNSGMATFSGEKVVAWVSVPGDFTSFELSIFDGDSGKDNAGNLNWAAGNWDDTTTEATYTLYADPLKDGAGSLVIAQWLGNTDNMLNNAWFTVNVNTALEAQSPSRNYFYRLEVTQPLESKGGNTFKLRSNAYLSLGQSDLTNTSIALMGMMANRNDALILYPQFAGNYNNPGPSTYTGDWQFYFYLPNDKPTLEFWNGDFDRGTSPATAQDTDDPNTSGKPEWASVYAVDERAGGQGAPADDFPLPLYRRTPPVQYELIDPGGSPIYTDIEPSGTEEWERFVMSTDLNVGADLQASRIQPGYYTIHIQGLDVHNLVFLRVNHEIMPICGDKPCDPPPVWPEGACPRTIGYWKNNVNKVLIQNKTNGVQESRETLEWGLNNVALASPLFRSGINVQSPTAVGTVARLTDQEADMILQRDQKTYPGGKDQANSMLARALQQNLAAWLNLGTGKIGPTTVVHLTVADGVFDGTAWEALQEAQNIILNGGNLERAKDIADQINNGNLGEDAATSACSDYTEQIPPDKQPPDHEHMPKAPKPQDPPNPVPEPPADPGTCGARVNTYGIESPTNNPFYGIKFEYQSGTEIRDGDYELFEIVLPADVVNGLTSIPMEAKASTEVGQVTLEGCQFNSELPCGDPVFDDAHNFTFQFMGAKDNGDGTYTLTFMVQVMIGHGLSHATIGLPDGVVPSSPSGNYQSEVCPTP